MADNRRVDFSDIRKRADFRAVCGPRLREPERPLNRHQRRALAAMARRAA